MFLPKFTHENPKPQYPRRETVFGNQVFREVIMLK